MAYDGKLLARARTQLDLIRSDNQAEHQRRLSLVYARVPEIQRMDETMRRQMTELVRLTISHPVDLKERLAALEKDNLDIQMRRAELLVENGWPVEYLDDIYSCPKCRDSGVYEGGVCSCLEKLYNKELTKELGTLLQHGDESFERFDLNYYDAAPVGGVSPRETMTMVLGACRKFADNFPAVSANLLFQGGTGLGKSYRAACIARAVANKG